MEGIVKAIIENGNSLGAVLIMLLGSIGLIYALLSDPPWLYTRGRYASCESQNVETKAALLVAQTELREQEKMLIRLQVEKELKWQAHTRTVNRKAKPR